LTKLQAWPQSCRNAELQFTSNSIALFKCWYPKFLCRDWLSNARKGMLISKYELDKITAFCRAMTQTRCESTNANLECS
jgi:hypothetical protein